MLPFNKKLKIRARELRKNMTDAERLLWSRIRRKQLEGYQFYRQKNIRDYIVDFYCPAVKLIIEVDGGQHCSEQGFEKDGIRDQYLTRLGFTVLRFSNTEVLRHITGVVEKIYTSMAKDPLAPH